MNEICKRLKKALDLRDMKAADLAKKTGIGKSSISTYLSGNYKPKIDNLQKMADAMNVNVEWLAGRSDYMEGTELGNSLQAADKDQLYLDALDIMDWYEKIVNDDGQEYNSFLDEEENANHNWHTIWTNGAMSFEVSKDDIDALKEGLLDYTAEFIQRLIIKRAKSVKPKAHDNG